MEEKKTKQPPKKLSDVSDWQIAKLAIIAGLILGLFCTSFAVPIFGLKALMEWLS